MAETVGINNAKNAGLLAARILSIKYPLIGKKLEQYKNKIKENIIYDLEDKIED